jgi:hypothetical protein
MITQVISVADAEWKIDQKADVVPMCSMLSNLC